MRVSEESYQALKKLSDVEDRTMVAVLNRLLGLKRKTK